MAPTAPLRVCYTNSGRLGGGWRGLQRALTSIPAPKSNAVIKTASGAAAEAAAGAAAPATGLGATDAVAPAAAVGINLRTSKRPRPIHHTLVFNAGHHESTAKASLLWGSANEREQTMAAAAERHVRIVYQRYEEQHFEGVCLEGIRVYIVPEI
jgi:4-aminobutyrate aminotransferase-like enzyme